MGEGAKGEAGTEYEGVKWRNMGEEKKAEKLNPLEIISLKLEGAEVKRDAEYKTVTEGQATNFFSQSGSCWRITIMTTRDFPLYFGMKNINSHFFFSSLPGFVTKVTTKN